MILQTQHAHSRSLRTTLWVAQALLAVTFVGGGIWKLSTPFSVLGKLIPWAVEVPRPFFFATAILDLLGGIGIVGPSLTRIATWLTPIAAGGCALLQLSAIVFHLSRGEAENTPFNFLLMGLSLFVLWGRRRASTMS